MNEETFCINCDEVIKDGSSCLHCGDNFCKDCLTSGYCSNWREEKDKDECNV